MSPVIGDGMLRYWSISTHAALRVRIRAVSHVQGGCRGQKAWNRLKQNSYVNMLRVKRQYWLAVGCTTRGADHPFDPQDKLGKRPVTNMVYSRQKEIN